MKLLIIRTCSNIISSSFYNMQEVGLAKALLAHGVSTEVVIAGEVPSISSKVICSERGLQVTLTQCPVIALPGRQGLFPQLFSYLKRTQADIVQVHEDSQISSSLIALWAKARGLPVVLCQGMYQNYDKVLPRFLQVLYDHSLLPFSRRAYDACIVKSSLAGNYLRDKRFDKISLCHIGLDDDVFRLRSTDSDHRHEGRVFADNSSRATLLYVGKFEERRNVRFLLEIFKELKVHYAGTVRLVMIGDGPQWEECRDLVRKYDLSAVVTILPPVPQAELSHYYQKADAFLLPTRYEIYGMVILESMYFGLPVIASSTAGSEEIISHGEDGLIVSEFRLSAWTQAILSVVDNRQFRLQLSSKAASKIQSKFLWSSTSCHFFDVYNNVLGR